MMKIAIAGSGNVATHLALGLHAAGCEIVAVAGRTPAHAAELASKTGAPLSGGFDILRQYTGRADAVIVSLGDNAFSEISTLLPDFGNTPVFHTSGTIPMEALAPATRNYGIIYPLQTFSKDVEVDLARVPFFTEGRDNATLALADKIAGMLSPKVAHADAAHRRVLHIAGVLSCNFPNYLWECVENLLAKAGYGLDVVEPLVRATVDKAFAVGPHASQTGPARRGDLDVIHSHARALGEPMDSVYLALSEMIMDSHHVNSQSK